MNYSSGTRRRTCPLRSTEHTKELILLQDTGKMNLQKLPLSGNVTTVAFCQNVVYDWKLVPCSDCDSIVHPPTHCPTNPQPSTIAKEPPGGGAGVESLG
ncbi:hypothetical protein M5K25_024604 [Dendrobium thyrsiflorum]|uniref:Uncharacterized protein n=1 Tax=Dendrobium thyrsiflorum TaxID=117978 RepID=A0ABD0U2P1_DENTH